MSIVKASELAYCRMRVPDLDRAEQFLTDFGLIPTVREEGRRFFRGTDPAPYCYVVEQGESERFLGFGFHAKDEADLQKLADATGSNVEPIDAPGGGKRVRVTEPNGYAVDLVWGIAPSEPIEVKRQLYNSGPLPLQRKGELYRLPEGVTPVKRLAHVVLGTPQVAETIQWLKDTFGLISSDDIVVGPEKMALGSFLRQDQGDEFVDHHIVFIIKMPIAGLQHLSFESQDIDAVMAEHHHLMHLDRYEHLWGIGRHLLGSQVFDYWADPWGYAHEHWADSDRLNASTPSAEWQPHEGLRNQWGDHAPERFQKACKP